MNRISGLKDEAPSRGPSRGRDGAEGTLRLGRSTQQIAMARRARHKQVPHRPSFRAVATAMARKRRGRGVRPGYVSETLSLGTLATLDVIAGTFADTVDVPTFAVSADISWNLEGLTGGEGPIVVGLAHGDYTAAEIEEWIENQQSWSSNDMIGQEIARRKIRQVGIFPGQLSNEVLNDGKSIRTKLRMKLAAGQTLQVWAYNRSVHNPLTTGAAVKVNGIVWLSR